MTSLLEYVWFGGRLLCRVDRCPKCGQPSFVDNFRTTCCDGEIQFIGAATRREAEGVGRRRFPSKQVRDAILGQQGHHCFYCEQEFGSVYARNNRELVRRVNWDHFLPFAYLQSNPSANWVAACNVCNQLKQSRIFYDREEAKRILTEEARSGRYLGRSA